MRNRILVSIPDSEYLLILPHLEFLRFPQQRILHEPNKELQFVYFLNSGLVSLMIETREGKTVEVGIVGNGGMVGITSAVGLKRSPLREVVQVAGDGFSVKVQALQSVLLAVPVFRAKLGRFAVLQSLQTGQTAACNRLHNVEQRFARWLLMAQARSETNSLAITHDFLSAILGTDRPSVSLVAGNFQRAGLIEYKRGVITILNRKKLEKSACECYAVIRQLDGELDQD